MGRFGALLQMLPLFLFGSNLFLLAVPRFSTHSFGGGEELPLYTVDQQAALFSMAGRRNVGLRPFRVPGMFPCLVMSLERGARRKPATGAVG